MNILKKCMRGGASKRQIKQFSSGFTLIELLVVVLIIGILAAIAVPQYTKSVEKSRAAEALTNGRSIAESLNRHFLATGKYTTDIEDLDLSSNLSNFNTVLAFSPISTNDNAVIMNIFRNGGDYWFAFYVTDGALTRVVCAAGLSRTKGVSVCKSYGGTCGESGKQITCLVQGV